MAIRKRKIMGTMGVMVGPRRGECRLKQLSIIKKYLYFYDCKGQELRNN
jgi:hypothetical protein